eukprot:TRINITY_DN2599_c1_g2_i1.p1 TRINITY_DN2599_c1_g2~~TRINITY_DN2599_c1_g2_i1.p1  ORF type:complete len:524 (+),score=61.28 TRINITY_DN2599_c1_g2_i1:91-1662(+)
MPLPCKSITSSTLVSDLMLLTKELKDVVGLSVPSALNMVGLFMTGVTTFMFISRAVGTVGYEAFTLANLSGNLIGMAILSGMMSGMDTLVPQALGAKRYSEMGDAAVRALVCSLALFVLVMPVWIFSKPILIAMGQPEERSELAADYLRVFCFSVPGWAVSETIRKFMSFQNVVLPFVGVICATLVLQAGYLYVLVVMLEWELFGCGVAQTLSWWTSAFLSIGYCWYRPPIEGSWPGFRWSALEPSKMIKYLRLGIPGLFTSEWWYWEAVAMIVGTFPDHTQVAAHACAYMVVPVYFLLTLGIGIGLNIKLGQMIGDGKAIEAKKLAIFCSAVGFLVSITLCVFNLVARPLLLSILVGSDDNGSGSDDEALVMERTSAIWPWVSLFVLADSWFAIQGSILRALGMQLTLCIICNVCLWVIGLPSVLYMSFSRKLYYKGVWYMLPLGQTLMVTSCFISHFVVDWRKLTNFGTSEDNKLASATDAVDVEQEMDEEDGARLLDVSGSVDDLAVEEEPTEEVSLQAV